MKAMQKTMKVLGLVVVLGLVSSPVLADALTGDVVKQATNWSAIVMFLLFVAATLGITYWASNAPSHVPIFTPQAVALRAFKTV
jgi:hypothetical protein